jgi:hypothetical protein
MIISRGVGVNWRVGERFKSGPGSRGQAVRRVDRNVMGSFGSGPVSGVYKLQDMCEKCVCGGFQNWKEK